MGFSERFIRRPVLSTVVAFLILLLGAQGITSMSIRQYPKVDETVITVTTVYPGASADVIQGFITSTIEKTVSSAEGVDYVTSSSALSTSTVSVHMRLNANPDKSLTEVIAKVQQVRGKLPSDAQDPVIQKGTGFSFALMYLAARSDNMNPQQLTEYLTRVIQPRFATVAGVADAQILGAEEFAMRVWLDPVAMAARKVTATDILGAITASNFLSAPGSTKNEYYAYSIEAKTTLQDPQTFGELPVRGTGSDVVRLRDVARIELAAASTDVRVRFNGQDGVFLGIMGTPEANPIDVAAGARKELAAIQKDLPQGTQITLLYDSTEAISSSIEEVVKTIGEASLIVVLVILLFLGSFRAVAIPIVTIPLSLIGVCFLMWGLGYSLNTLTLLAMVLAIGLVVDDAIVVVENIHRWKLLHPEKTLLELIPGAVDEVGGPTILATLTVIAALLPMAFVTGLMGPYMSPIPINSSLGMAISLAVAFIVTPWLAAKLLAHGGGHGADDGKVAGKLDRLFHKVLPPFLDERSGAAARKKLFLGVLAAIFLSVSLAVVKLVVLKMLPFDNKSEFQVVLDMPVGTPLEETARVLKDIGAVLQQVPEVTDYQAYAGTASPINFNGLVRQYYLRSEPEMGDIQVNLVDKHHRSRQSHEIAVAVRAEIEAVARRAGGNAKVVEVPPGPPVMSPIVAEIYGPEEAGRIAVAKQVRGVFEKAPDFTSVDDSVQADAEKAVLRVSQTKAAQLGVAQKDIVEVVRMGLAGEDVTPAHNQDSKYEIPVRITLPAEVQSSLDALLRLKVRARSGALVPVSEVVEVRRLAREKAIYHKDLLPVVYVYGDMGGDLDSPLYGMFAARGDIVGMNLDGLKGAGGTLADTFIRQPADPYAGFSLKWDGEWQITYETFRDMGAAYGVGLILIYLLVVAHFKSYVTPLIIMAPIPLTIIGVMPGHALLRSQFTATSMIGMIALAGIIVRNSILLVDFIKEETAKGMPFKEAIVTAAAVRAKPIALTALAAMLGALFILDDPIFNGLAISLIFGILVSTLLTLVVIPVLYYATFKEQQP